MLEFLFPCLSSGVLQDRRIGTQETLGNVCRKLCMLQLGSWCCCLQVEARDDGQHSMMHSTIHHKVSSGKMWPLGRMRSTTAVQNLSYFHVNVGHWAFCSNAEYNYACLGWLTRFSFATWSQLILKLLLQVCGPHFFALTDKCVFMLCTLIFWSSSVLWNN
jgi:hypothetical protein